MLRGFRVNNDLVAAKVFDAVSSSYSARDTILYALGIGACSDPLDLRSLRFVYERDLQVVPSQCCVLAHPGAWFMDPELQIDWVKLLHAEQRFELHQPLPVSGTVIGSYRINGVVDKGASSGALMYMEKRLRTAEGQSLATVRSTYFLRGDGGAGSWGHADPELPSVPATPETGTVDSPTSALSALVYRLSGDLNPLHADPAVARSAGFDRPILHGLCTYGIACKALISATCNDDASRLREMSARFTRPVYPGDTIRTKWWQLADGTIQFQCISLEHGHVVLDRGLARIID